MRATAMVAFGVAVALAGPAATAQPRRAVPPPILFEVGPQRGAGEELLRLREELRARQVVVDPRAIAELSNEILPLTGTWDEELTLAELTAQLDSGVRAYLRGQFKPAAAQLEAGLALARRNPALVVRDATSPHWLTQAMASLALTKQRLRDREGAREAMAEQLRSFPEIPVTLSDYGSRGEALYLEVRRELEAGPRGSLLIDVTDPDARIYVNERGRGRGGAYAADVLPGAYRVLVVVGAESRLYRVAVHANEQTRLQINWREDERYRVSPRWAGLMASEGSERMQVRLGRRLAFRDVIVIGVIEERGARRLWGAVYERGSGRRLRRGEMRGGEMRGGEMETQVRGALREAMSGEPVREPSEEMRGAKSDELVRQGSDGESGDLDDEALRFAEFLRTGSHAQRFQGTGEREAVEGEPRDERGGERDEEGTARGASEAEDGEREANVIGAIAFAGIGLAGVAGGAYYALESTKRKCPPCEGDRSPILAVALVGGGILSVGVASFFALEQRRAKKTKAGNSRAGISGERAMLRAAAFAIDVVPRGAVASVGWAF